MFTQMILKQYDSNVYQKNTKENILGIISSTKFGEISTYSLNNGFLIPSHRNTDKVFDQSYPVFETVGLIPNLSSIESLLLLTCIKKMVGDLDIRDALKQKDFVQTLQKYIGISSFDICEQIEIAYSIVDEQSFILLNDPFKGLDKQLFSLMVDFIFAFRKMGKIILLTSQSVSNVRDLCEVVCEHKTGELVLIRSMLIGN